jgi:membrane protease YdiL (CAAX protease family)
VSGPETVRRDPLLVASLAGAYAAFAAAFRGPPERFWQRMTRTGAVLGTLALASDASLRQTRIRGRDAATGLASAAVLYGIFQLGDHLARRIMPRGGEEIGAVYSLRGLRPIGELAARLALVVAPAEELFWRGFVQRRLAAATGPWEGATLAAVAYGGAHASTGNATLIGAATVAGAYWSALAAAGLPMAVLIMSHVAWDLWIFLVAPTSPSN